MIRKKLDASGKKKWRKVIDFKKLNENSIRDNYPLTNSQNILDKAREAR